MGWKMITHVSRVLSLLCLLETGAMGDARLCTFEINGEPKYYVCPRNEQCCKVGCCLSPSFQFYQLWYYWLMVIFMLVVCSGGQWWYKYWVGGGGERSGGVPTVMMRARATSSAASQPPPRPRMGVVPSASASAASSSASATVPTSFTLIHQICKPHHYHSRGDGKVPSPYDQIYGPPPSYESVMRSSGAVLPPYSLSPEPAPTAGDPLGAVDHIPMSTRCPSYSQSHLPRPTPTPTPTPPSPQSPVSPADPVPDSTTDEPNCDNAPTRTDDTQVATSVAGEQVPTQQRSSQCLQHQNH